MYPTPYEILGISSGASRQEIKKAYKEIALSCHPDKLLNVSDIGDKQTKIELFRRATVAYNKLINDKEEDEWDDWNIDIKDILANLANMFAVPTSATYDEQIVHNIKLAVRYEEILNNSRRKLRLILKGVDEPVYVTIGCGAFPQKIVEYDNHDIIINMYIDDPNTNYEHIILKNGGVDLITTVHITIAEYILGCKKDIEYVDGTNIPILLPPFIGTFYEIANKGLKKGSLILNISLKNIEKDLWAKLCENDKVEMIRILNVL